MAVRATLIMFGQRHHSMLRHRAWLAILHVPNLLGRCHDRQENSIDWNLRLHRQTLSTHSRDSGLPLITSKSGESIMLSCLSLRRPRCGPPAAGAIDRVDWLTITIRMPFFFSGGTPVLAWKFRADVRSQKDYQRIFLRRW